MTTKAKPTAEPETFGPEIQGFGTNDAILAFCLRIAGLPFTDERQPLRNSYDMEMVKGLLGSEARGLTLKEGVERAFAKKKKGSIRFLFKRVEELGGLLRAFEDEKKILTEGEVSGDVADRVLDLIEQMARGELDKHECILRIACDMLTARTEFNGMWRELVPYVRIWIKGKERRYDDYVIVQGSKGPERRPAKVVSRPGFKEVPLNAPDGMLKDLKL